MLIEMTAMYVCHKNKSLHDLTQVAWRLFKIIGWTHDKIPIMAMFINAIDFMWKFGLTIGNFPVEENDTAQVPCVQTVHVMRKRISNNHCCFSAIQYSLF